VCGIAGVWRRDRAREVSARELEPMLAALRWRGGDGERVLASRGFGCAIARLALQDPRPEALPPFRRGSWTLVANGELWDHERERERFERAGQRFATKSDQEVLAALVAEDLPLAPRALGMYALAAHDAERHRLILERDPWGQKPLFLARLADGVAFASTLPALLAHPEVSRDLDLVSLADALSYGYVPGLATPYRAIERVAPGARLVFDAQDREGRSASFEAQPGGAVGELSERFARAVRSQLVADRERALFLSGGIDSALVAAAARDAGVNWRCALTARFEDGSDERTPAHATARALGLELEEVAIDERVLEELPQLTRLAGEPLGDASLLSLHALARAARARGAAIAFGGDGADEWFFGYDRYRAWSAPLARGGAEDLEREGDAPDGARGLARFARLLAQRRASYPGLLRKVGGRTLRALLRDDALHAAWCARQRALESELPLRRGSAASAARFDRRFYLPNGPLAKGDLACHAAGVELRAPFLDPRVIAAAPLEAGAWWRRGKRELRSLARVLGLPRQVARARKRGFRTPLVSWLRSTGGAASLLAPHRATLERRFAWSPLARWIAEHDAGRRDHATRLYHALALAHFLSAH
jgi:asparagine synthase (glutamine-hydrolysing)